MKIKYIKHKTKKCSICKEPLDILVDAKTDEIYWDHGNNAEPVNSGKCCQLCDTEVVLPTRLQMLYTSRNIK